MLNRFRAFFHSPLWMPAGVAVLAPLLLFADVLFTGRALIWGLPALQFTPWRYFAWLNLKAGSLPWWNPLNGMGAPLLANDQLALFYPPGWPLYLLAAPGGAPAIAYGHTLLVALHLAWAGLGMARLLRGLGMGRLSQTVGALAFGLCGYFTARNGVFPMVWTGAWLPWVLWAANRVASPMHNRVQGRWLALAVTMAMLLLAGHAQVAWYTLFLAGAWTLAWSWRAGGWQGLFKGVGWFALAGLAAGLLSAAQLVPTAEYLLQSQRSGSVDYEIGMTYSFWPWRLLAMFAPDLFGNPGAGDYWGYAAFWEDAAYIGLLPLILALTTIPSLWRKGEQKSDHQALTRFLWGVVLASLLLALGKNTPIFPLLYQYVPTFDIFQAPARFLILTDAALVLLAGMGVEGWRKPTGKRLKGLKRATAAAAALVVGAAAGWLVLREIKTTFLSATALAGVLALGTAVLTLRMPPESETGRRRRWTGLVVAFVLLDLLWAGLRLHPSAPAAVYRENSAYNQPIARQLDGARIYLTQDEEYRLKFSRFLRFSDFRPLEDPHHIRQVLLPNANLLDGIALTNNFDPLVPARYSAWMEALEALSPQERLPWLRMMNVGLVEQIDPWISLGVQFQPVEGSFRWYWADCPVSAWSEEESWQKLRAQMASWTGDSPPDWVVLENVDAGTGCQPGRDAQISLVSEIPGRLVFTVDAEKAGWLVVNDSWYPGWKAKIDDQEWSSTRANYLFQAVTVPSGQHMVTLFYSPSAGNLAVLLSGACWIALMVVKGYKMRSQKK